jgi:hypothetical protein
MADVLEFNGVTRLKLDPQRVLSKALEAGLSSAIVIGYDADGKFYFGSTDSDGPSVLWDLEKAKQMLLSIVDEEGE